MTYKDLIDQQAKDYAKSITKNDTYSEYLVDAYKAGAENNNWVDVKIRKPELKSYTNPYGIVIDRIYIDILVYNSETYDIYTMLYAEYTTFPSNITHWQYMPPKPQ